MSERECYKLVKLDVHAAEHGWQREEDIEADTSGPMPDDSEGDYMETGIWSRELPDGRVCMFGIAYGRRRSTQQWNLLIDNRGFGWHATVGNEHDTWPPIGWPSASGIKYWLAASGEEFLERHAHLLGPLQAEGFVRRIMGGTTN